MQLKWLAIPIISASAVLSYAPTASAISLVVGEEPVTQLSPPPGVASPMMMVNVSGVGVSEPITSTPLLCGNTSAPAATYGAVSPLYFSPTGVTSLKPFVFGASVANPTVSAFAKGASMTYGSTMRVFGDPALVCYGLDANGVHSPTPGVLRDEFEGVTYSPTLNTQFNSSVVLTTFHVPTSSTDFYGYTVDVSIPAKPANVNCATADCNFALLEGFDTSIFDTAANADHSAGWCLASAGATSCPGTANAGGINLNYATFFTNGLPALTATGASPTTYHFVVKRFFRSGVTALPVSDSPVAIAALFSPFDFDENFIGDNVSAGYGNSPPAVVQAGDTWTLFSGKLGALAENTDSGALTFNITDADTPETGSNLKAAVTLNLSGLQVPVTPNCTLTSGGGTPVNRSCTIDVNFADPNWWNASVGAAYQGQGNLFATDPGGVGASASIVATDAAGKSSAAVNVPIHVQSKVNSAPVVAFGGAMPNAADSKQGGTAYPTYSCSVAAANCGGSFNVVELNGVISGLPGPPAAFDELASQTTDVNSVVCGQSGEQDAIFLNQPIAMLSAPTSIDLLFQLKTPLVTGSSLCTVAITDKMAAFPAGEAAQVTNKQFRVVVNP